MWQHHQQRRPRQPEASGVALTTAEAARWSLACALAAAIVGRMWQNASAGSKLCRCVVACGKPRQRVPNSADATNSVSADRPAQARLPFASIKEGTQTYHVSAPGSIVARGED
jgi:hypothetical protein